MSVVQSILRRATRIEEEPINILSFPTHERYQENLSKTGENFYLWQSQGIKPWVEDYAKVPAGTVLLNPDKQSAQIPEHVDVDIVLSQNKFGQFEIARQIADHYQIPLISIEHTLPMQEWSHAQLESLYNMRGDVNIFISEYSREKWGWNEGEAIVIHHGVDTELFKPNPELSERNNVCLSVVNDWINRDWCCGYNLWAKITGFPSDQSIPVNVIGDTPGLSQAASSTEELIKNYQESSIFLNTSLISPVPTSLLEAMSCGCAIVTTATCMIPEIIKNGENGFMSNNPDQLRDFTKKLLADKKLAKEMGENARQTIVEKFGLNDFVNKWKTLFSQCLG